MVFDIFLLEAAFIISYIIRFGVSSPFAESIYAVLGVLLPILHIFIVFFTEEYSGILRRGYLNTGRDGDFLHVRDPAVSGLFPKRAFHYVGNQHRIYLAR